MVIILFGTARKTSESFGLKIELFLSLDIVHIKKKCFDPKNNFLIFNLSDKDFKSVGEGMINCCPSPLSHTTMASNSTIIHQA